MIFISFQYILYLLSFVKKDQLVGCLKGGVWVYNVYYFLVIFVDVLDRLLFVFFQQSDDGDGLFIG